MARSLAPARPAPRAGTRDDDLVDVLQEVSRRLVGLTASALANVGPPGTLDVTLAQYRVLVVLTFRGGSTPTALAADLGVSRPAITRTLRNLEARQLVNRRRDPRDGRQAWIEVAQPGTAIVDAVLRHRARSLRTVARTLSSPERAALKDSLVRLLDVLRAPVNTNDLQTAVTV